MPKRPNKTEDNTQEITDAIILISKMLHGRPGEDVQRILGVVLLTAACQGILDIDTMCTTAKGLLKQAKEDWKRVAASDTLDG